MSQKHSTAQSRRKALPQTLKLTCFRMRSGKVHLRISENFEALKYPFQGKGFRLTDTWYLIRLGSFGTDHSVRKCLTPNCFQVLIKLEICVAWRSLNRRKSCRYVS